MDRPGQAIEKSAGVGRVGFACHYAGRKGNIDYFEFVTEQRLVADDDKISSECRIDQCIAQFRPDPGRLAGGYYQGLFECH